MHNSICKVQILQNYYRFNVICITYIKIQSTSIEFFIAFTLLKSRYIEDKFLYERGKNSQIFNAFILIESTRQVRQKK
jgi:hypothetical protein